MKTLVIHPGSLGDVVLSLPALRALKQAYPMARLDLIGNTSALELLKGRFYADRVISIDRADVTSYLAGLEDFSGPWKDTLKEYSLIVNWLGNREAFGSAEATAGGGGTCLPAGRSEDPASSLPQGPPDINNGEFSRPIGHMGPQKIVASRPISRKTVHQHRISIFLESLSSLQIPTPFSSPQVFVSSEDRKLGQEALRRSLHGLPHVKPQPVLAIHPGSGGRYKCWDLTRFVEVSRQAKEHLGFQLLFILGPAESGLAPKLKNSLGRDVAILDSVPLPILAGAFTGCSGYLGNDSGVTHLAAALGIPTVAIFGPTDPHLWGPVGQHVRIISKRVEGRHVGENICQGCGCLDSVSVKDVIQRLAEIVLDYSVTIC